MNTQDVIKQEAKKFLIDNDEVDHIYDIHINMFTKPIEKIFFWVEDDYSGEGFVVYRFGDNYLFKSFGFGSCDKCDFAITSTFLDCFDNLFVSQELSMNMLEIAFSKDQRFLDPELVKEFGSYVSTH